MRCLTIIVNTAYGRKGSWPILWRCPSRNGQNKESRGNPQDQDSGRKCAELKSNIVINKRQR